MLNNTVGGSLAAGEKPLDGIIRECEEEICLDPAYINVRNLHFQSINHDEGVVVSGAWPDVLARGVLP